MNDDLIVGGMDGPVGSITVSNGDYSVITSNGISPLTMATTSTTLPISAVGATSGTISMRSTFNVEDFLEEHIMNRFTVDHKVQEQELMRLRETTPDYANEIKESLASNCARDMIKKLTFTKKHDKDADVHHFIGRVWLFTEEELKNLLLEVRNV